MEPPHGARPKWNRLGRPTSVIEEPKCLEAESTGGGHRRFRSEGGRDERSGSKVATASPGYTGGSNTPEERH